MTTQRHVGPGAPTRRSALCGAGALALAACSSRTGTTGSATSTASSPPASSGPRDVVAGADAVVRLDVEVAGVPHKGSGVVLSDGRVLTAAHVVEGATTITIRSFVTGQGATRTAGTARPTVVVSDTHHELALLESPDVRTHAAAVLGTRSPRVGDVVFVAGRDDAEDTRTARGVVTAVDQRLSVRTPAGEQRLDGMLVTDVRTQPGMSGGAVLDTAGQLVALITGGAPPGSGEPDRTFAVPVSTIRRLLAGALASSDS